VAITNDVFKTQDPKYDIHDGLLINSFTGTPIPMDEPVFLIRAKDIQAVPTLYDYLKRLGNADHVRAVEQRIEEFEQFAATYPQQMKEPDTSTAIAASIANR